MSSVKQCRSGSDHSKAGKSWLLKTSLIYFLMSPAAALADRVVLLPPVDLYSVHGGNPGTNTCVSADMLKGDLYPYQGGVRYAFHVVTISVQNLANIETPIDVVFLKGSGAKSSHSNGAAMTVANVTGGSVDLSSNKSVRVNLKAKDTASVSVQYSCRSTECQISFSCTMTNRETAAGDCDLSQASNVNGATWGQNCGGNPQTCITLGTKTFSEIRVRSDRGSLVASVSTAGHRCDGHKDHFPYGLPSFQVQGGRAF